MTACGKVQPAAPDAGGDAAGDAPGPARITVTNQRDGGAPINAGLVAYQDGDGGWQAVSGTNGVYTLQVRAPRYGLVTVCEPTPPAGISYVLIQYHAVSDGNALFMTDNCDAGVQPTLINISGFASGQDSGDTVGVSSGMATATVANGSWSMKAAAGTGVLLGTRLVSGRVTGIVVQHPTFSDGASYSLNFANQVLPAESNVTIDPTATQGALYASYLDAQGDVYGIDSPPSGATTYRVLPADLVGDGISSLWLTSGTAGSARQLRRYFKAPKAQTMTLPGAFQPVAPTIVATTPYQIPKLTLSTVQGGLYYDVSFSGSFDQPVTSYRYWKITYTAGWIGDVESFDATLPDLTGVAGWGDWGLPDAKRTWHAGFHTGPAYSNAGVLGLDAMGRVPNPWHDGDEVASSSTSGTF